MADTGDPKLKEIGGQIRALRRQRGWTIEALAFAAHLSGSQISQIENGLRDAQITTYMKIADAFGVSITVLFPPNPDGEKVEKELMEIHEKIKDMEPEKKKILYESFKSIVILAVDR